VLRNLLLVENLLLKKMPMILSQDKVGMRELVLLLLAQVGLEVELLQLQLSGL
jgi:hypothetical protein